MIRNSIIKKNILIGFMVIFLCLMSVGLFVNTTFSAGVVDSESIIKYEAFDLLGSQEVKGVVGLVGGKIGLLYEDSGIYNYKVFDLNGGTVFTKNISENIGSATTLKPYAMANGKTIITVYEGNSFKFIILDENGTIINGVTNITESIYSDHTAAVELSNGNIVFLWRNDVTDYYQRIFNASGNSVTAGQSINIGTKDGSGNGSSYHIAANNDGSFMITYNTGENNYYYGILYNNDGTQKVVGGFNHFKISDKLVPGFSMNKLVSLSNNHFAVFYSPTTNSQRSIKIFSDDGIVVGTELTSDISKSGDLDEFISLSDKGFLVADWTLDNELVYVKEFDNIGVLVENWQLIDVDQTGYYPIFFSGYNAGFGMYNDLTGFIVFHGMNYPPTNINLSDNTVDEGLPAETVVGTLSAVDDDIGDTQTFSIISGDTSSFTITGSELRTNGVFNHGTKSTYNITIRVTDSVSNTYDKAFTIDVNYVNKPPTGTIEINDGDAYTNSTNVTLNITSSDPEGDLVHMKFSNDNVDWSDSWIEIGATKAWSLSSGDGTKTVYMMLKDDQGNTSDTYSDTIVLDTIAPTGTVSINNGAVHTNTTGVTLNVTSDDGTGVGGIEMRFSNDDNDWSGSVWETAGATKSWSIFSGEGAQSVYMQLRDSVGNVTNTIPDSIVLDTIPPVVTGVVDGTAYNTDRQIAFSDATTTATAELNGGSFTNDDIVSTEGTHQLVVTDEAGNTTTITFTIDKTPPVIILKGEKTVYVTIGTEYLEPGFSAVDNHDGDISGQVQVTGQVNHNELGEYTLRYNVIDSVGNTAIEQVRTVHVVSDNANLSDLVVVPDVITPDFSPDEVDYSMTVEHGISEIRITTQTEENHATLEINGKVVVSGDEEIIPIKYGLNVVEIVVTAQDSSEKMYTVSIQRSNPPGSPVSPGTPSGPRVEIIEIDVIAGKNKETTVKITIKRSRDGSGMVVDKVILKPSDTLESVKKASEAGEKVISIIIPDNDEVSEVSIELKEDSLSTLADGKHQLQLSMKYLQLMLLEETLQSLGEDIYFRVVPLRQEDQKEQTSERLKQLKEFKDLVGDQYTIVGDSLTIETNMTNREVKIRLPINAEMIPDGINEGEFLNSLVVYIEHSDGEKVLQRGNIVIDENGSTMLEFTIYKFSTFTVLSVEGQEANVKLPYVNGYSDGSFRPNQSINRAEMASLLARVMDLEASTQQFSYTDVSASHWGLDNIDKVHSKGLMKANEQGNFRPSDSVTRAEMAAIISRWLGLEVTEDGTPFTDVSSNHWAFLAIEQVKQAGIMNGYNDGTFKPSNALTRAEAVTIINRIIGLEPVSNLDASSFSDVSIKHWALGDIEAAASNKE